MISGPNVDGLFKALLEPITLRRKVSTGRRDEFGQEIIEEQEMPIMGRLGSPSTRDRFDTDTEVINIDAIVFLLPDADVQEGDELVIPTLFSADRVYAVEEVERPGTGSHHLEALVRFKR